MAGVEGPRRWRPACVKSPAGSKRPSATPVNAPADPSASGTVRPPHGGIEDLDHLRPEPVVQDDEVVDTPSAGFRTSLFPWASSAKLLPPPPFTPRTLRPIAVAPSDELEGVWFSSRPTALRSRTSSWLRLLFRGSRAPWRRQAAAALRTRWRESCCTNGNAPLAPASGGAQGRGGNGQPSPRSSRERREDQHGASGDATARGTSTRPGMPLIVAVVAPLEHGTFAEGRRSRATSTCEPCDRGRRRPSLLAKTVSSLGPAPPPRRPRSRFSSRRAPGA
jgi:hypothetical protein